MTTPNKPNVPAEMPPPASADLVSRRDPIIAELEKAAKDVPAGTLQQVLRKMVSMLASTKPGAPLANGQAMQDVKDAFARYAQDTEAAKIPRPAILLEAVEWMQAYVTQRGFPAAQAGSAAPAAAPAAVPASKPMAGGKVDKDGFDSGRAASHARSLTGEVPVKPGEPNPQQKQLDDMKDTLKNWQLNTSLGKVRG